MFFRSERKFQEKGWKRKNLAGRDQKETEGLNRTLHQGQRKDVCDIMATERKLKQKRTSSFANFIYNYFYDPVHNRNRTTLELYAWKKWVEKSEMMMMVW